MADSLTTSPPPGGDQNRGWQLLAVHSTFSGIVTLLLFARLYTRLFVVKKIGLDDYGIVLGVLTSIITLILDVYQVRWGWGRHTYYLLLTPESRANFIEASKLSSINEIVTIIGLFFTKVSIGLLLLRIFGTKRAWRWTIYAIIGFVFVTTVISFSMVLAQCRPLTKLWNHAERGSCWSPDVVINVGYYNGAIAVISDWALSTVPIAIMWNLQMSLKKKVGVACLMGLGYFTGATAIVRTVMLKNLTATDITYDIIPTDNWAGVEIHLGIIAACVPAIKPLFSHHFNISFYGWSKIVSPRGPPSYEPASEDKRPLHKPPKKNMYSISEALKTVDDDPRAIGRSHDAPSWNNRSIDGGSIPTNVTMVEGGIALEDLQSGRGEALFRSHDTAEEQRVFDQV